MVRYKIIVRLVMAVVLALCPIVMAAGAMAPPSNQCVEGFESLYNRAKKGISDDVGLDLDGIVHNIEIRDQDGRKLGLDRRGGLLSTTKRLSKRGDTEEYVAALFGEVQIAQDEAVAGSAELATPSKARYTVGDTAKDGYISCEMSVTIYYDSGKILSGGEMVEYYQLKKVSATWKSLDSNVSILNKQVRAYYKGFDPVSCLPVQNTTTAWYTTSALTVNAPKLEFNTGYLGLIGGEARCTLRQAVSGREWSFSLPIEASFMSRSSDPLYI